MKKLIWVATFSLAFTAIMTQVATAQVTRTQAATAQVTPTKSDYQEPFRPQLHFSPRAHWMNDPNGMVYYAGIYHLFFQYYPDGDVWGPMHWGHAISKDLIHWQELPIAIYPDSLGYIFSGSAVVDKQNSSGFGKTRQTPLVAIFTQHDPKGEQAHTTTFQNQSIACSLDSGKTWIKYAQNPVLKNPGITDFRDPKVSWYEKGSKWIMTLAVKDRIMFYGSRDLKNWTKESEFGAQLGAHGGVWECPDLFPLEYNGQKIWVLIVNINPGGPNGGSATQYFLGDFDGTTFTASTKGTRWLNYGPDEYAGVTWSNTGEHRIFLGWMSNWAYGTKVPTTPWRSANNLPVELGLQKVGDSLYLCSVPLTALNSLVKKSKVFKMGEDGLTGGDIPIDVPGKIEIEAKNESFEIGLANGLGEKLIVGYDKASQQYYIDRTHAGKTDFADNFAGRFVAPRISKTGKVSLTMYVDASSVELFADDGLTSMAALVFPGQPYARLSITPAGIKVIREVRSAELESIWKK